MMEPMASMTRLRGPLAFALACCLAVGCGGDPITPGSSGTSGQPITSDGGIAPPVGTDGGTIVPPTSACNKSAPSATGYETGLKLASGRTFSRFTAANYDPKKAHALVFVFHGDGGTGASARAALNMEALAGDDAIFIYPDGTGKTWDLDKLEGQSADLAFVDALITEHSTNYCVNPKRIFSSGFSRGGYMANHVACRMGNVIRGVAAHAGGGPYSGKYDNQGNLVCNGGPVAAAIFNGLSDGSVAPAEGDKTVKYYARAATCAATSKPYDPSPCVTFDGCGQPLVQCKIPGLGHQVWNQGAKTSWDFFSKL